MRKKLCTAALCGWALIGAVFAQDTLPAEAPADAPAPAKNIAENPSFENVDDANKLIFWEPVKSGYHISKDLFHSGQQSLRVKGTDTVGGFRGTITVPRPGCKLLFKVHLYIKSFSSGVLKPIHVSFVSGTKTYYRPQVNLFPNQANISYNTWLEYKAELDLSDYPDVEKIVFWCLGYENQKNGPFTGEVFWDDVSVEEL